VLPNTSGSRKTEVQSHKTEVESVTQHFGKS
jgi:hypothetical protein